VLPAALLLLSPSSPAQDQHQQAIMMVTAHVVHACRIDVQDDGQVRLHCGSRPLALARVAVNGRRQETVPTLAAAPNERFFLLPPAESVLASASADLAFHDRSTDPGHSIVVSIQF
jgi:hypothetical protein